MKFLVPCLSVGLCLSITPWASLGAEQPQPTGTVWTQWRGPERTGVVQSNVAWPETLGGDALEQVWRVELGPSYSGPIVTETRIFVTETIDKKFEVVRALDRQSGRQLWELKWEGSLSVPFFAKSNGDWIRSTPIYDEGRLYVAGMRDVLVCIDADMGHEIWRVDFVKDFEGQVPDFGFVCSPLIDGEFVYVQAGGGFAKLDKRTGERVWQTLNDGGGMMGSAFSSPIMTEIQGVKQLVVQTREKLCGVHPESGELLWSQEIPSFRGMNILTPTVIGNRVFTSSYGGESFLFEIAKSSTEWNVKQLWNNRKQGYMSSPVVIGDHIYLHLRNQRLTCLSVSSGEDTWTTESFGKYWSMITDGQKILALDERGELLLIQANPNEFRLLDSRKVAEAEAWAHVGIAGQELFVRDLEGLTVYRWGVDKN